MPLNFTTTPGSIVNVTPAFTVTCPVTIYGPPDSLHVVLTPIAPEKAVGIPELAVAEGLFEGPETFPASSVDLSAK